ncbi:transposase [Niallia circulans]|uniref:transposase n=1 Tax=Niallia circulans TaxID=1397 RepID=UPI00201D7F9A|nr:transposase [Niallia circulans]
MPRKKRVWYSGASYHITSRGIRRTSLFLDEEDRKKYLRLLTEVMEEKPFILQTYCLMTNHIHLQIKTLQHSPSDIIRTLHFNYAIYFNKKYFCFLLQLLFLLLFVSFLLIHSLISGSHP